MEKRFVSLRDGKTIYVEIHNKGHKDNLLILHGGPGEGCGDFQYQSIKLADTINIVNFDQRGVLRSDKIETNEQFGLDYLVEDCEDLKNILGITKWCIWGHSFGAEIALLYASRYPDSVERVIFENPAFCFPKAIRRFYDKCIEIAYMDGNQQCANELKEFLGNTVDIKLLARSMRNIPIDIIRRADHRSETSAEIELVNSINNATQQQWSNRDIHFERLQQEGKMNQDFTSLISTIKCPTMLILGKYDSFSISEQIEAYKTNSFNGRIVIFENSGHRPHDEEPDKFTELVIEFLNGCCMKCELKRLSVNDGNDIYEMLQEIPQDENGFINSVNGKSFEEYKQWLVKSDCLSKASGLQDGWKVPTNIYWLYIDEKPIGMGKLRHFLTDQLRDEGGHAGYIIRPSQRNNGFGTILLKRLAEEAKKMSIEKILLTIRKENTYSVKVALDNCGKIENSNEERIYIWIDC